MYKLKNGFTKKSMLEQIKKYNNDTKCVNDSGGCIYNNADNTNRCLVGCFIPDNHKSLSSTKLVYTMLPAYPDLAKFMPLSVDGLATLQILHDGTFNDTGIYELAERWININVEE